MNESIQTQGKTVNEAVSEALLQLGLRRDEVEIKVIEEPKSGLLGFIGTRPAKVLVRKKPEGRRGRGRGRDNRSDDNAAHSLSGGRSRGGQRRGARNERAEKDGEGRRSSRDGGRGGRGRGGRGGQGRKPAGNEVRAESRGRSRGDSANEPRKESRNDERASARKDNRNAARNDNRSGSGSRSGSRRYRADTKPDAGQDARAESREARTDLPPVVERGEGQRSNRSRRGTRGRGRGRDRSVQTGRDEQISRGAQVASDLTAAEFAPETPNNPESTLTKEKISMTQDKTNQPPTSPPVTADAPKTEPTPAATAPETPTPVAKPKPKRKGWGGGVGSRLKSKANPAVKAKPTRAVDETPAPSPSPTRQETRDSGYDRNDYRERRPSSSTGEVIVSDIPASKYAKVVTDVTEENLDAALSELTNGTLARAGFPCDVQVHEGEYRQVRITSDDESIGLLIGRHGQTVDAVEHLVERMASNAIDDRVRMNLDINEYRRRREDTLRERVVDAIAEVRDSGKAYHVEPMSARERRLVHLEVEPVDGVRTYTMVGSGGKYVVISLDDETGADDQNED